MDIKQFKELPLLGIIRGVGIDVIEPLVESVISSGLKTIEIAMNTSRASELIKQTTKVADKSLCVGAGTVLTMEDLHEALDAGATFIVLPVLVHDVVKYCVDNKIPVFPGALTPQEIFNVWNAGATMVKVFPAKFFGQAYFKEIKGPFPNIELLACGGVNSDNIRQFFSSGTSAVAFGTSIFKKELLAAGNFSQIENSIKTLIANFKK